MRVKRSIPRGCVVIVNCLQPALSQIVLQLRRSHRPALLHPAVLTVHRLFPAPRQISGPGIVATVCVAFAALLATAMAQYPPPPNPNLTVAFWNIQWFPGQHPNSSAASEKRQITAVHAEMA